MTYYPTIHEDLRRAKEILARGRPLPRDYEHLPEPIREWAQSNGVIVGADLYAAYRLLESFVEVIETLTPGVVAMALRTREWNEADQS